MTFFYKCIGCGKILGFGSAGKGGIHIIKTYGECCYDIQEEADEIDKWRKKQGLDTHGHRLSQENAQAKENKND